MRMLLPLVKHLAAGGAKLVRRLPRSERMSASEKADVEWCGAADRGRPTATDQLALGKRQVGNNCGHSRIGQFNSQNAMNGWCGELALPPKSRLSHGSIGSENHTGNRL